MGSMMNVLKSVFGVCSGSAEKSEVHDTVRRIFGNDLVMKENTERSLVRSKYLSHIRENLPKILDSKVSAAHKVKTNKKHTAVSILDNAEIHDDRPGRVGPRIVVFDASTGTGRLVLVGDERVSVQGLSSFATIRATACVYAGRWMYEVQLGTKGIMQIGWCTSSCLFSMDTGVGDTANSYAYDGGRVRRWNVATSPYGQAWLPGDVIGSCIDLDSGTLEYFRNGVSMGVAFTNVTHGTGIAYFPAVSLAMQEHLYANFGHVPFVFGQEKFAPLQLPPVRDCARAALLFKSIDALLDELTKNNDLRPVSAKSSKARSETSKGAEDEVALRIHSSNSVYSPKPSPHQHQVVVQHGNDKRMSRKAFLMSLARLAIVELGSSLRLSYVVVSELLPRLRGALGIKNRAINVDQQVAEFFNKAKEKNFADLSSTLLTQPQPKLCTLLDLLWTFLDEAALCDILEHCIVRECLLFDLVSPDMHFTQQQEGVFVLCGLMQHVETRHHLVKYVFFNKISFDNFLNVKCPDDAVLRTVIRNPWWQRPTTVQGETDPRVAEMTEKGTITRTAPSTTGESKAQYVTSFDDVVKETQYKEDCNKITKAIEPLEQIQLEFLLMLLDNSDGTNMVPSTRKIFLEKFRRYIMDNCILDMRLFNISRNSPAISWCCHARLLTAVNKLWGEKPLGHINNSTPPFMPPKSFIDGELDYYNVDRLGGVLPFLVRTLRQDLINVLGEENPFVQSFEPTYNRGGGIDMGVSEMGAGSPGLATLPQVISSMARFMHTTLPPVPNRSTGETALALKGARSMMPGAGSINVKTAYLRLLDGLLALYHGVAIKHAEKLCELRDNQQDMADCLHDIDHRIHAVASELHGSDNTNMSDSDKTKRELTQKILRELERSKKVYEEKLKAGALQMAWVIGAVWTQSRQAELAKHFAGTLHSMRLASDPDYAAHTQVASKEILPGKSSLLGSYASLQLEYTDSSSASPATPNSTVPTPRNASNTQVGPANQPSSREFADSLFAFVPEYHVDAMLELCNTLRLYMHPTVPVHQIPEWEELMVSCASFLCSEFADQRIVLASTRESLVQTLASFATQPPTMRAIERVPVKHQMCMVEELVRPYQNRAWAQSNWVLVRFWHGSGFGFRHRQWPHLAARYGDREPTVNNLGAKVDAGLMSQCFGPCPSEVIQQRIRDYLAAHPKEAASFFNSLLSQLNWAFSEFITMMQEMDRINVDSSLESRQIKLCATCFDLYHGLARALEMAICLAPTILTKPEACDGQNELLLGRTCQMLMGVVSRVCARSGGGSSFARLVSRGLPDTDRVHYYVALAPVAGCVVRMLDPQLPAEHLERATKALASEPLFSMEGLDFMLGKGKRAEFSFYNYPEDVTVEELRALEAVVEKLRTAKNNLDSSPGGSGTQSELLCTICYARPADTAFVPCGHHSCRSCVMQHMLNSKQCFFCKAEIQTVREIEPANS